MSVRNITGVFLFAVAAASGCSQQTIEPVTTTPSLEGADTKPAKADPPASGTVVILPGIQGQTWQLLGVKHGLQDAGLDRDVELLSWNTPLFHSLQNLVDYPANLKRARRFAARLTELHRANPDKPLTLIGFSGGGGVALLAIEALPDDVILDRVILIAAAISHDYDLTEANTHCRDKIINFFSKSDGIVGWGTSLFGTIDRKNVPSAGHCGFIDSEQNLVEHDFLVQIPWDADWMKYGHWGGHIGYHSRAWAQHVLAPQVDPALRRATATSQVAAK